MNDELAEMWRIAFDASISGPAYLLDTTIRAIAARTSQTEDFVRETAAFPAMAAVFEAS